MKQKIRIGWRVGFAKERGQTLLELMISIAIGLFLVAAIFVVYLAITSSSRQSSTVNRMSEDAAVTMAIIGNNIRMAGYSPPRAIYPPGVAVVDGVGTAAPDRNFTGVAFRGCDFGFSNPKAKFEDLLCNTSTGLAAFSTRFEGDLSNTIPVSVGSSTVKNPSDCLSNAITVPTASDFPNGGNYTLVDSRFSVASASNGTPELSCAGSGGTGTAQFAPQPLMQYVESMILTYGISSNESSGNVVRYVTQTQLDSLGGTLESRWNRVVNVKVCLIMRSEVPDQNNPGNYIDCANNSVASATFVRRSFTSVFALRNRADFFGVVRS